MAGSLLSSGYSQQQSRRDGDFFGGFFGARDESCSTDRSYPGCTSSHGHAVDVHPGSAFSSHSSYDSYTASAWAHSLHPPPSQLEFAHGAAGAPALANAQRHGHGYGHGVQRYDGYGNTCISAFHSAPAHGSQLLGGHYSYQHGFPGGQFPGGHFPGGLAAPGVVNGSPTYLGSCQPWGTSRGAAGADSCSQPSSRRPSGDHRRHRSTGCC
jgi:hypothetical protein